MTISPAVHLAWQLGAQESIAAGKTEIGPIQFFCGMARLAGWREEDSVAANGIKADQAAVISLEAREAFEPFAREGIDLAVMQRQLRDRAGRGDHRHNDGDVIHRSSTLRDLFLRARMRADQDRREAIELRDILGAMIENRNLTVSRLLKEAGVPLSSPGAVPGKEHAQTSPGTTTKSAGRRPTPVLDTCGRDLTKLAKAGRLGPVIGRRDELLQLLRTLARQSKNSPVLVGEPGVGKTAVVESLAIRLAEGKHRDILGNCRIVELSMASLVAGAKLLGEREERLEALIGECRANPDVLLFIDELHTMVTAGGQSGTVDPKDIFKPALARGEIRCIGATTLSEFQKYIEPDAALERRFDRVIVSEPSAEETLAILKGLVPKMQAHHGVRLTDDALRSAIELSMTYDTAHQLPDKAIDLVDKAATNVRVPALSVAAELDRSMPLEVEITPEAVARALAGKLGLPAEALLQAGSARASNRSLETLEAELNRRVLGQSDAARAIAERLVMAQAGLTDRKGPRAVFLFSGTTGVGKTQMACAIAECLFASDRDLIRLDMSEYMEPHDAAKLVGAPPGYIGHDEAGQLTAPLRARPHSVVLLDEIDKAHPRILDLMLQVFDVGRITDAKGRLIDARHAIIVMTANTLADRGQRPLGFVNTPRTSGGEAVSESSGLMSRFRPEFVNRIDATIRFRPLDATVARTLTERHVAEVRDRIRVRFDKTLTIRDEVIGYLVQTGFSEEYGARELKRTIERLLDSPLSALLLSADTADWPGIEIRLDDGRVVIGPA